MTIYLLYSGNAWLNTSSQQLLSVCSSIERACELARQHSNGGAEPMSNEDFDKLVARSQTYGRDENYLICETEVDELE